MSRNGAFAPMVSSRSCAPEPCTSTTAGNGPAPRGKVNVAGRPSSPPICRSMSIRRATARRVAAAPPSLSVDAARPWDGGTRSGVAIVVPRGARPARKAMTASAAIFVASASAGRRDTGLEALGGLRRMRSMRPLLSSARRSETQGNPSPRYASWSGRPLTAMTWIKHVVDHRVRGKARQACTDRVCSRFSRVA
jgi:hypothetical protein